ncbi:MAG TPA: hypothetical protein VGV93_14520 [Acidimicrobiales bacterium]|nr:hypothetical protein [Acidimicrobiales bacterium]
MRPRLLLLPCLLVAACGPTGESAVVAGDERPSSSRYRVSATVLESPGHGPQLCQAVAESYPPQCSGPDVVGWDWATAEGEETANGTTWGAYEVTGTWDGTRLTLTEPPGPPRFHHPEGRVELSTPCPEPDGGWLVMDRAAAGDEALARAQERAGSLPGFAGLWIDQSTGPVLNVRFTDDVEAAETELREVWGGALCVSPAERSLAELQTIQAEVTTDETTFSSINAPANVVEVQVMVADPDHQAAYDARYGDGAVVVTGWLEPVD